MVPEKPRVLLLDDETAFTETLGLVLVDHGCQVYTSTCLAEALARCRDVTCDLILMDLSMPGVHGVQALRCLTEAARPACIVVVTGHANPSLERELLQAGAARVLRKPVELAEVLRLVDSIRNGSSRTGVAQPPNE